VIDFSCYWTIQATYTVSFKIVHLPTGEYRQRITKKIFPNLHLPSTRNYPAIRFDTI